MKVGELADPSTRLRSLQMPAAATSASSTVSTTSLPMQYEQVTMNHKLRTAAGYCNQLAAWQLQENWERYSFQLKKMRNFIHREFLSGTLTINETEDRSRSSAKASASAGNPAVSNKAAVTDGAKEREKNDDLWAKSILSVVEREKLKMSDRITSYREKLATAHKEFNTLAL
jgi:hypothetical protein